MKIKHYLTFDRGSGPITFIKVTTDNDEKMYRFVHNAKFDKSKEVDVLETEKAVMAANDLGDASTKVKKDHEKAVEHEVLRILSDNGHKFSAIRWNEENEAITFTTMQDAIAWSSINEVEQPVVKTSRRIMG